MTRPTRARRLPRKRRHASVARVAEVPVAGVGRAAAIAIIPCRDMRGSSAP